MAEAGQSFGARLVTDLVLERCDVGDQVGLATGVDRIDREPAGRRSQQVVATVRIAPRLADLDQRPDARERERPPGTGLEALSDQDNTEGGAIVEAVARQRAVAILEDVEGQDDARTQDRVQREERDLHRPSPRASV